MFNYCVFTETMSLTDSSQVAADKCNAALKEHYITTGSYVNINPWVDDDQMHIDIYTKLQLEESEGASVVVTHKEMLNSIEYEKIFLITSREGDFVKRLIFFGEGGVGKSTFFDKIAYDWAGGYSDVLNKYKLVFVLKMCALTQSSNLIEAIFDQLLAQDTDVSKDRLESFIVHDSDVVLILMDGFDELTTTMLSENEFGSILRALNGKTYRECCIGVTTRPSHLERLTTKSLVQNPCIHLKVLGFTKDDVKEYVRKFFGGNSEALIEVIKSSDVLSDLARSPMLLLLICIIWREDEALPSTMSHLYSKAVDYIFKRKDHESDKETSEVLIKIGEVALIGLLDPELKLAFPESAFEKNTLALALKVGILNSQRVFKNRKSHNSIQFLHKTFQELCAAKYWQRLPPIQFQNILDRICDGTHNIHDFEYLLRFCCGDNAVCMKRILIPLLNPELELNQLALNCYFEGQSKEIPSETYIKSLITDTIDIDGSNSDFHSLMFFLSNVRKSEFGRNYLGKIEGITLCYVSIMESVDLFALVLSNMTNVKTLTLYDCSQSSSEFKTIALSLKDNTCLNKLRLDNTTLGGTASQWAPHIQHLKTLRTLSVCNCNIQPEDMEHIMKNVSKSKTVCEVRFYSNRALGGAARIWSCYLCLMIHIKELDLGYCSLVCNDIEHIANALSEMTNLTNLFLRSNRSLGGSAIVWSSYLCLMIHIKKLDLGYCSLVCNDIEHIANALSEMTNLTHLNLEGNSSLGGYANVWSRYLYLMKHLQVLDLGYCSLLCNNIEHIANALSGMTNLTDLSLEGNSSLGGPANVSFRYLCLMIHMKKLDLGYCSLLCNNIAHIANALSKMPNLTDLSLSGNSSLGGSAIVWSRYLCFMKHLQVLDLGHCSLDTNDVISVVQSLSEMTSPTRVNLAYNPLWLIQSEQSSCPSSDARCCMLYLDESVNSADRATISELLAKMTKPFSVEYVDNMFV